MKTGLTAPTWRLYRHQRSATLEGWLEPSPRRTPPLRGVLQLQSSTDADYFFFHYCER